MYSIEGLTAEEVWSKAARLVSSDGLRTSSRNFRDPNRPTITKELLHVSMTIRDPRSRLVFSRPINPAFGVVEAIGILAGFNDLKWLEFWNPRMKTWATPMINNRNYFYGAYGGRLGARPNVGDLREEYVWDSLTIPADDQMKIAYQALKEDPDSRQVVMNIYNHQYDLPTGSNPSNPDIPCNLISDLKVRDGKLHWMQTMRSNDLMWGTPYNFIQWTILQEVMAGWLGLEVGQFTLCTSSLHVYENHWEELDNIVNNPAVPKYAELVNKTDLRIMDGGGYDSWEKAFAKVVQIVSNLSKAENADDLDRIYDAPLWDIASYAGYKQLLYLLLVEAARRLGVVDILQPGLIKNMGYYRISWDVWKDHIDGK